MLSNEVNIAASKETRSRARFLRTIRVISRFILHLIARVRIQGLEHIPPTGEPAIVVTNHLGRLDAMLAVVLAERDDFILFIAEKYQKYPFWRWIVRRVDGIWLNRYEADLQAMRQAYRRLQQGEILGMAPEGTRSETESLAPGKPGAAYLAAKGQLPIIPIGLTGTEDRLVGQRLKRLRRLDIDIRIGEPFVLPPMVDRKQRDAYLEQSTEEIMCRIAVLLPPPYRGVYADHPRVGELLAEQAR